MKTSVFKKYFPNNRADWNAFTKLSLYTMVGSFLFSLNGFIDNFMVGNLYRAGMSVEGIVISASQAQELNGLALEGLGAAGQWWFIVSNIASFAIGGIGFFLSQYYTSKDYDSVSRAHATKIQLASMIVLPVAILIIAMPQQFMSAWTHYGTYTDGHLLTSTGAINAEYANKIGSDYIRVAAFSWFIWVILAPTSTSSKECGRPQGAALSLVFTLITHVGLNAIFIYTTDLGAMGPAIALCCSRLVNLTIQTTYVYLKDLPLLRVKYIFTIDSYLFKRWAKRWQYPTYGIVWTLTVAFRSFFWGLFFNQEVDPGSPSALAILSVAGSIQNVFLVASDGLSPVFSKYVSGNMSIGKNDEAKKYADQALGYGMIVSGVIAVMIISFAFGVPYMTSIFNVDHAVLVQAKFCLFVVALIYWDWVVLTSIRTILSSGSKVFIISLLDGIMLLVQTGLVVLLGFIHKETNSLNEFWFAYLLFFSTDLIKLPVFWYIYKKGDWVQNLAKREEVKEVVA